MRLLFVLILLLGLPAMDGQADPVSDSRRTAVVRAVERVQPAVVSIHVVSRQHVLRPYRDPFFDFFAPYFFVVPEERDRSSTGSGLVVSADGYILTNDHVIEIIGDGRTPHRISVSLPEPDGRTLKARYVASDINFDLAVLKVDVGDLPVAPLGDSGDILVGEWAIAIGNPFDLGPTVSIGVVSALDRDFSESQGDHYYRDMIQTDAAINPGNSGGPLVNALGQVIGINSFIYTGSDYSIGSIGIGFAIPINMARSFLDEVRQHGQVRRAWTGILSLQDLTRALAEYLSLSSTDGALVVRVARDSPAYLAGLDEGDVIVAINGEKVRSADEAIGIIRRLRVEQECALSVVRDGQKRQLTMRPEEYAQTRQHF